MRGMLPTLLVLALAGCGSDYADRLQVLDAQRPETVEALSRLRDLTLASFDEWEAEDPASCNSHNLESARASVLLTAGLVRPERYGFPAAYDAAEWMLEVADAAAKRGCNTAARDLYFRVNAIYTGAGYVRLREHALTAAERLGSS